MSDVDFILLTNLGDSRLLYATVFACYPYSQCTLVEKV